MYREMAEQPMDTGQEAVDSETAPVQAVDSDAAGQPVDGDVQQRSDSLESADDVVEMKKSAADVPRRGGRRSNKGRRSADQSVECDNESSVAAESGGGGGGSGVVEGGGGGGSGVVHGGGESGSGVVPGGGGGGVYSCSSCSRSFTSRRELVTHRYMHRESPTAFCAVCNKSFSTEAAYRRHAATHNRGKSAKSASRRTPQTCRLCEMQFDTIRQLSTHHTARHVDEKRFVCSICGSQFAWLENLTAHQRTHELDPHECELCGRRFVDATSMRVHTRNAHGPASETLPPRKQHCCKLCGRSFQFDFSLRAHMKGHAQSPVAAALRQSKHHHHQRNSTATATATATGSSTGSGSGSGRGRGTVQSVSMKPAADAVHTKTKYVRVDSEGVIDLGLDVASTPVNERREIIVEVYNGESAAGNTHQTLDLDFSDVLDQSTKLSHLPAETTQCDIVSHLAAKTIQHDIVSHLPAETTQCDSVLLQTNHETAGGDNSSAAATGKLVWYVKPDSCDEQRTEPVNLEQQQQQQGDKVDKNVDDDGSVCGEQSLTEYTQHKDSDQPPTPDDTAAAAATSDGGVADDATASSDVNGPVSDVLTVTTDVDRQTGVCCHGNSSQHQQLNTAPADSDELEPASTELTQTNNNNDDSGDDDDDDDDDDDEIDWMVNEPPPARAAPLIYRRHDSTSSRRRRTKRAREPFLFNCVMTDEKPFICVTCGQSFRWEISLSIHRRVHTDGTFPNKTRGRRGVQSSKHGTGKARQSGSPTKSSSVPARSYIVRHQRTSSDEDEDEFTFHVHADGPTEVPARYPAVQRLVQAAARGGLELAASRGARRGRGQGRGGRGGRGGMGVSGGGRAGVVDGVHNQSDVAVIHSPQQQQQQPVRQTSRADTVRRCDVKMTLKQRYWAAVSRRHRLLQLRARHSCPHCQHIITSLSAFNRHRRRLLQMNSHSPTVNCPLCTASFSSRLDLLSHRHRHHYIADTVSGNKLTKCQ